VTAREAAHTIRFAVRLVWRLAAGICSGITAAAILDGALPVIQALATGNIVNLILRSAAHGHPPSVRLSTEPLLVWFGLLSAVLAGRECLASYRPYLGTRLRERLQDGLSEVLFRKSVRLPLESLESDDTYNDMERAFTGSGALHDLGGDLIPQLLSNLLAGLGILALLLKANWLIPAVLIAGAVPFIVWGIRSERVTVDLEYGQTPLRRLADYWRGVLTQIETAAEVRLYRLDRHILPVWRDLQQRLVREKLQSRRRQATRGMPERAIYYGASGAAICLLVQAAVHRQVTTGMFVALLYAMKQYWDAAQQLMLGLLWTTNVFADIQYVQTFLDLPEEPALEQEGAVYPRAEIRLENVTFIYSGAERPALDSINLEIPAGQRVAIVGENGAGKTTLARLALGLYRPTSGRILINGADLETTGRLAWRQNCAALFQEFMCYRLPARENIGFGNLRKMGDNPTVEEAAARSGADRLIAALPHGYDTRLGKEFEDGCDLSYGQWQKIALARAYVREPALLVLDEPAAALDAQSEQEMYHQFRDSAAGKTVLLITHRLGSARLADRVIRLESGRVVEDGTHEALIEREGGYAQLFRAQMEWYRMADSQQGEGLSGDC